MSPPKLPEIGDGWRVYPSDPELLQWLETAGPAAEAALCDPAHAAWLRHGGTWFAGVDVLPNDPLGRIGAGPALNCEALRDASAALGLSDGRSQTLPLHRGQVSVAWPGYPKHDGRETAAAHRYRRHRDAAHLDGLLPVGPERRRMLREPHAWILGLPLSPMRQGQAPLVVWAGSQEVLRNAIRQALAPHPPEIWDQVDVTDAYKAARRRIFETCARIEIRAEPGQAILLHRLILHGIAPWDGPTGAPRSVIYFRPVLPGGIADWLALP
ncbi:MAG: hypothetical protein AAGA70_00095 [Pseudomonadota bacterium]